MIVRYGGGNNGIAEYLENGRKAEREYTRDELDHRLILDGDLLTTNKVIQSIQDKGQERYLHITLSFAEKEISHDNLKAIATEYKNLFMNAYHDDEHAFYAEAHLPKIKNLVDNKTGELVERKPHIHIIIPRLNLITGKSLNPRGDLTIKSTQDLVDSIQEHINNKYGLISPKDCVRVSDENYANVLSRVKGDLYRERNNEVKREIFSRVTDENVNSVNDFKKLLQNYGDVKVRNEGKSNEYIAVKFGDDAKFTNLKNPLFSRSYIETRQLPIVKPTPEQIERNLKTWIDKVSHEIKHIYPKSEKLRNEYKALDTTAKSAFLKSRIEGYDQQINKGNVRGTRGRTRGNQSSLKQIARFSGTQTRVGLSRMPQRGLVRGISGRGQPPYSLSPLPDIQQHHLAERMETRQRSDQKMRRELDSRFTERGIKTIDKSSVLHESLFQKLNAEAEKNEVGTMANIRRDIDPERFLSAVSYKFNVKTEDHAVSVVKDGSPRFAVDKRNLNASDFLTKYLNLSWKDAKEFLLNTYSQQLENKPFDKPTITTKLNNAQCKQRYSSLKESNSTLRNVIQSEKRKMYNELRSLRKEIFSVPKEDREVAKGIIVYKKLTTLERLAEISDEGRNFISQYHKDWNEDKDVMKSIDKLKQVLNKDEENGIAANDTELSLKAIVEAQKRIQEHQRTNSKLKDLVMDKHDSKIVYRDQVSEKAVFTDKGDFIVSGKPISKEEIGIMLDYSKEKFGGVLKLTGSDEFKQECARIAAEKDMNVILRPDKYQKIMLETKNELEASREKSASVEEHKQTAQAEDAVHATSDVKVENQPVAASVEREDSKQVVYLMDSAGNVWTGKDFEFAASDYSNAKAFEPLDALSKSYGIYNAHKEFFKENELSLSMVKPDGSVVMNNANQQAWPVAERAFKENLSIDLNREQFISIRDNAPEYQAEQNTANAEPTNYIYFAKFNNAALDKDITGFATLSHTVDWRNMNTNLHDIDKKDVVIYRVDERIADQKGLNGLDNGDAQPVTRYELEKAQGKDISEQDAKILDVIDRYQAKSESEGIEFNRNEVEGDLLNRDLTVDIAEERLERQYSIDKAEKENNQEQEH